MKQSATHTPKTHQRRFIDILRGFMRDDRGDTPIQVMIGAFIAILLIVPSMTFFVNFLATTSVTAVDAERSKDMRAWSIDEFETKPWDEVLATFKSNKIETGDVATKFNFGIKYAVDNVDASGGYVVKLVAPQANVDNATCNDPRAHKTNVCLYYQYTKTPTLSEGLPPTWNGMNYGNADLQPASGTTSPALAVTTNRTINVGTFNGCSALTPDKMRISFKWVSTNGIRPTSVQHLVIGGKLYETIPLSSSSSSNTLWYAATINKPQASTCYSAEQVRIVVDNGAKGTLSDLYVSPLLNQCTATATDSNSCVAAGNDTSDANIPNIVSNPVWATDGLTWYFSFDSPLTGTAVSKYQIRGTGTESSCNTNVTIINEGNASNGTDNVFKIGSFNSLADLKKAACDRYYVTSLGTNGYNSAEVNFTSANITKVVNVDGSGSSAAPATPTTPVLSSTATGTKWSLKFSEANISTIDHFNVTGKGTNAKCVTTQQSVNPVATSGNIYSLGTFTNEAAMRAGTCDSFKVVAVGNNGQTSNPVTFTTASITNVENL
jgi:hypothetical protein